MEILIYIIAATFLYIIIGMLVHRFMEVKDLGDDLGQIIAPVFWPIGLIILISVKYIFEPIYDLIRKLIKW